MPMPSFLHDVATLIEAATGRAADPDVLARVQRILVDGGIADDAQVPAYWTAGLRALAAGATIPWTPVAEAEQGLGWLLCRLADVVPGTTSEEVGAFDRLACPALGRTLVVQRQPDGREQVAVEADVGAAPVRAPRVLGTFQPTVEQIRRWALDPDLYFTSQDEEHAIDDVGLVPLLVELAADPAGPKRARLRQVLHRIGAGAVVREGERGLAALATVAAALTASPDPDLRADGAAASRLAGYLGGAGPVDAATVEEVARALLVAPGGPAAQIAVSADGAWWRATVRAGAGTDVLAAHQASGVLVLGREPGPADAPAPHRAARLGRAAP